jgi:undecaprenol kinase
MSQDAKRTPTYGRRRSWRETFRCAARGAALAAREERNVRVHLAAAGLTAAAGVVLGCGPAEWALLSLAIAAVLAAELLNSAVERLARALTPDQHPLLRDALDLASGAVLVTSLGALGVAAGVFGPRLFY